MRSLLTSHKIFEQKFGIITPWYGHRFGGAEKFVQQFSEQLQCHGFNVEVFTTACSSPYADWASNDLPRGKTIINNVPVQRFSVETRNAEKYAYLYHSLLKFGAQEFPSQYEKELFINSINSSELYDFIRRHKDEYIWLFAPYMYGTTFFGLQLCGERSLLFPCLHDEPFAQLTFVKQMFQKVCGVLCLSFPEKERILKLYSLKSSSVHFIGCGISPSEKGDPLRFRKKFNISTDYFLYIGKKDMGKNLHILVKFFQQFVHDYGLNGKLVLIGPGELRWVCDNVDRNLIIDLGILDSEQDKHDALAGAIALCNPSNKESFSIVLMESWLQQRPVVVDYYCDVTRYHCEQANGGLYHRNYWEFFECLKLLITNRFIADKLGEQGKAYVEKEFNWGAVIDRFKVALVSLFS